MPPTALNDCAESNAEKTQVRLDAADLTKEVTSHDLEGMRSRASDATALLQERSKEIDALEA